MIPLRVGDVRARNVSLEIGLPKTLNPHWLVYIQECSWDFEIPFTPRSGGVVHIKA